MHFTRTSAIICYMHEMALFSTVTVEWLYVIQIHVYCIWYLKEENIEVCTDSMKVTFTVNKRLFSPGTLGKLQSIIYMFGT